MERKIFSLLPAYASSPIARVTWELPNCSQLLTYASASHNPTATQSSAWLPPALWRPTIITDWQAWSPWNLVEKVEDVQPSHRVLLQSRDLISDYLRCNRSMLTPPTFPSGSHQIATDIDGNRDRTTTGQLLLVGIHYISRINRNPNSSTLESRRSSLALGSRRYCSSQTNRNYQVGYEPVTVFSIRQI
jgi:hypothetical protein